MIQARFLDLAQPLVIHMARALWLALLLWGVLFSVANALQAR
ncbi:MAG TPA: hypothetical protein VIW29_20105 [Polyangiaceae bacterium]